MKRKGSLSLSVNAIVILIIAVAILGLTLGFLKTQWDKLTGQVSEINEDIKRRMLDGLKESEERIVIDPDNINVKQGKDKEVYFALANELRDPKTFDFDSDTGRIDTTTDPGKYTGEGSVISCFIGPDSSVLDGTNMGASNDNDITFELSPTSRYIDAEESIVGSMTIDVDGGAPKGVYQCSLIVEDPGTSGSIYARADFMITVT